MRTITVKQLLLHCKAAVANGYGDKKILLSGDDEGNEYHELFFGFTQPEDLMSVSLPFGVTIEKAINEYIILG